jgi:hypothetical protein
MGWSGQASEHDADHGETNEGRGGSRIALEVARQAPIVTDPGEGSLNDPPFGQDDEAMQFIALDDLQPPGAGLGDGGRGFGSLVAGIGEDAFDEREQAPGAPIENEQGTIAILHVGRMDDDVQKEAERVDENMPFAARDLLARIEALRVERAAPF